jgi:hypothetical protein
MDDVLVTCNASIVLTQIIYMRREKIADPWIYAEFFVTLASFLPQFGFWATYVFLGQRAALRVLALASLRAICACLFVPRMREIFSAVLLSYKVRGILMVDC